MAYQKFFLNIIVWMLKLLTQEFDSHSVTDGRISCAFGQHHTRVVSIVVSCIVWKWVGVISCTWYSDIVLVPYVPHNDIWSATRTGKGDIITSFDRWIVWCVQSRFVVVYEQMDESMCVHTITIVWLRNTKDPIKLLRTKLDSNVRVLF